MIRRLICWLRGHDWIKHTAASKRWSLDQRLTWPAWCARCMLRVDDDRSCR